MNNEDSLNVVFKISNSIDYEVKDKIVGIKVEVAHRALDDKIFLEN